MSLASPNARPHPKGWVTYNSISWQQFKDQFAWGQGEHILAIAPTGQGKTTLLAELVERRKWNLILGTKKQDSTYGDFLKRGFKRVESIHDIGRYDRNILLWPSYHSTIREFQQRQRRVFKEAFDWCAGKGSWTIWNDEEMYMCQDLKLETEVKWFLQQARSSKLTIINGTQRPAWIPVASYSGATHAFIWGTNVEADAKRLSDLGTVDPGELLYNLKMLRRYEFVYVDTRTGKAPVRTKVER